MREILARNVTLDEENEEREEFLTSIGLNPIWLHEMKAALAINKKEYKTAVKHLIGGKFYNRAHNVSSTYAFPSGGTGGGICVGGNAFGPVKIYHFCKSNTGFTKKFRLFLTIWYLDGLLMVERMNCEKCCKNWTKKEKFEKLKIGKAKDLS